MDHGIAGARLEWQGFKALAPQVNAALLAMGKAVEENSRLDHGLIELVKLRASQINGCAFCIAWHIAAAQKLGVSSDKLHLVVAWREAPQFDGLERAALGWTEAVTKLSDGVSDEVHAAALSAFSESNLAYLTSTILAINAWNRLGVAYRFTPLPIPKAEVRGA